MRKQISIPFEFPWKTSLGLVRYGSYLKSPNKEKMDWGHWLEDNGWTAEVMVALLLLFLLHFLLKNALIRSKKKGQLLEHDWRVHLDTAAMGPAKVFFGVLLASFLLHLLSHRFKLETLHQYVPALRNMGIVFSLSWFLLRFKKVFHHAMAMRRFRGKPAFDPASLEIVGKIFTVAVLFVSLLVLFGLFGLDILPLVTFGGIGLAALGFASREMIANFFGGLMIYATRPFTVGDQIEVPQRNLRGYVEEIGWYLTTVRDMEKKPVYIPNASFSSEMLINLSRMTHRCIEETVRIRFSDSPRGEAVVSEIRALLLHHPEIDRHQPVYVFLRSFGVYALEIEVRAYTLSTRYEEFMEIKQKILLEIHRILLQAGAEIPCPSLELSL